MSSCVHEKLNVLSRIVAAREGLEAGDVATADAILYDLECELAAATQAAAEVAHAA